MDTLLMSMPNFYYAFCSNDWPKTAELKAIDMWTILCYAGAFFCLVEYSMILYLSRQKVNSVKVSYFC